MERAVAQQCLREHHNAVLATWRRDGRLQMSPVSVGLDAAGRAIISSAKRAYKVRHLRRDPRATLCIFVEAFTGPKEDVLVEVMYMRAKYVRKFRGAHPGQVQVAEYHTVEVAPQLPKV